MKITFEQLKDYFQIINSAHQKRFSSLQVGQQIKLKTASGETLEGVIKYLNGNGLTVNKGQSTAGGFSDSSTIAWVEVIELQ
jgi:hypothetical protein